jgi:hypothetical protein
MSNVKIPMAIREVLLGPKGVCKLQLESKPNERKLLKNCYLIFIELFHIYFLK